LFAAQAADQQLRIQQLFVLLLLGTAHDPSATGLQAVVRGLIWLSVRV
jgi:hypothetical protein